MRLAFARIRSVTITWNLSIDGVLQYEEAIKKYNGLAGAALFGRVPRRGDDEAGEHDGCEIRRANASCLSSSRFHPRDIPATSTAAATATVVVSLPVHATRSPGLHGATSVTSALPSPRPQNEPAVPSERCQALVVETAPRRCNHLTRAPIARQATHRNPERERGLELGASYRE